jgi:hypothetical protein
VVMVVVVTVISHQIPFWATYLAASSQCSGISVCTTSPVVPV